LRLVLKKGLPVFLRAVKVKPDKVVRAFFRSIQIGILVRSKGNWGYYGLIPFIDDPRIIQIIQKQARLEKN
jgi:hypothetical protein